MSTMKFYIRAIFLLKLVTLNTSFASECKKYLNRNADEYSFNSLKAQSSEAKPEDRPSYELIPSDGEHDLYSDEVNPEADEFYRQSNGQFQPVVYQSLNPELDLQTIHVDKILGVSTATSFRSEDLKFVVKIYDRSDPASTTKSDIRHRYYELLLTQFFVEYEIPVAKIIDASSSVKEYGSEKVVIVKEYIQGVPFNRLLQLPEGHPIFRGKSKIQVLNELSALKKRAASIFDLIYNDWFQKTKSLAGSNFPRSLIPLRSFENKDENWIYSNSGWVLIDP